MDYNTYSVLKLTTMAIDGYMEKLRASLYEARVNDEEIKDALSSLKIIKESIEASYELKDNGTLTADQLKDFAIIKADYIATLDNKINEMIARRWK